MKILNAVVLVTSGLGLGGCTSYVRTFDGNNNQTWACVVHEGFMSWGDRVGCHVQRTSGPGEHAALGRAPVPSGHE